MKIITQAVPGGHPAGTKFIPKHSGLHTASGSNVVVVTTVPRMPTPGKVHRALVNLRF